MTGAANHRGASKQNYGTPQPLIEAVERRFGKLVFDLAAEPENTKCERYFTEQQDSLVQDWTECGEGLLWLNPPFGNIAPWAAKCRAEMIRGCRIAFLVPASVGSNWFAVSVFGCASIQFLRGRLSFDGKNPFPKDCMLAVYGEEFGCAVWNWREAA